MKVGIFTNLHKDKELIVTRKLINALNCNGIDYVLDAGLMNSFDGQFFNCEKKLNMDFMLTVGGDGTILRIAKKCAKNNVPIVGINLGHTGFLAEEEPSNIENLLKLLTEKKYYVDKRTLISATINDKTFLALNDVVISRANGSRMLETDVSVNGEFVDRYFCDGYIVSTPTGSTAYSLSAGGSILSPSVSALILTSINSHSLHSRPIVVPNSDQIILKVSNNNKADLIIDGVCVEQVAGEEILIQKARETAKFVRFYGQSFYEKLLTKLNKWSVTNEENK